MKKEAWLSEEECTACGACVNACPMDAISIELQSSGHLGLTMKDSCVGCGRCEVVCMARRDRTSLGAERPRVYAAWSTNEQIRFRSTSGGVFSELARVVLSRGGVVFGAAYGEDHVVQYEYAEDEDGLARLRQSKYVQSEVGLAFRSVRSFLSKGREVLFCGAPCQVAGLRAFLGERLPGLYLVDFVCRGVNSPKAYGAWIDELEREEGSSVSRVWFKYKVGGWKTSPKRTRVDFKSGASRVLEGAENRYMSGYLDSNLYLRPSCAACDFKGFPRQGDITVADFWGLDPEVDDDRGASMVMASTPLGEKLLSDASDCLVIQQRDFKEIFAGNVCIDQSAPLNWKSGRFLLALDVMGFSDALKRYGGRSLLQSVIRKLGLTLGR